MSEFQDWCNKPEVVLTGTGWGVRISGCDVFDPINQHGVKSCRAFDVVKGLASKEDAESFLANWLKEQLTDYDALRAENERLRQAVRLRESAIAAVDQVTNSEIVTLRSQLEQQTQWISVDERLPEKSGVYPACSVLPQRGAPEDWVDSLCMFNAEAKKGESKWQHSSGFYDNGITHWMPLPATPQ